MTDITIPEEEHQAYLHWKHAIAFKKIYASAARVKTVWDDIDLPIRPIVGALALLGCEPLWSCCGYDYPGQPIHKSHDYGTCGLTMLETSIAHSVLDKIVVDIELKKRANVWKVSCWENYGVKQISFISDIKTKNSWPSSSSIHFYEPGAIAISILCKSLLDIVEGFKLSTVLLDTNKQYQERRFPTWQFPKRDNSTIRRDDVVKELKATAWVG